MIRYTFAFDESTEIGFEVDVRVDPSVEAPGEKIPSWALLEHHRCPECPIAPLRRRSCPAAMGIRSVVDVFHTRTSYETVRITVERDEEVRLDGTVPMQQALRSLVGLLLPLTDCPVLMKLRPMAHFHLPLGGEEHTAFRFIGMHLIAQYLRWTDGLEPDWDLAELRELFRLIHMVNEHLSRRIRDATREDATINSLVLLDAFANVVELSVDMSLHHLRPLFAPYLSG